MIPQEKKICLGTGTTLNEKTCGCDCLPGYTEGVGGSGNTPAWSLLDFISPVQSNELKRCYPACPCNMERVLIGPRGSDLECSDCKSGYTWYPGANLFMRKNYRIRPRPSWFRATGKNNRNRNVCTK